ncbi:hypothetical protein M0L20_16315 [Spirosoma sp. RP8]|uniref:DUF1795 domain-containing protein n=1 Tax=Spirosoma liriopis TaxID=2937440 RepID=A0ABT0HP66_9BACT|nr:hypothetical protein [Spirosoma liriopis]MCK8493433.1 hypothetical protein [Spirosoma liriopis]
MNIEVATAFETAPLEVLDLQVVPKTATGKSLLSLRLLLRKDRKTNLLHIPTLSWFDASKLQRFSQELASAHYPETCQVDLTDAGIRLTGSVRRLAGRWTTGRTVRIEPLSSSATSFAAFTIHASHHDITSYAGKLYNRLWEVFTRG